MRRYPLCVAAVMTALAIAGCSSGNNGGQPSSAAPTTTTATSSETDTPAPGAAEVSPGGVTTAVGAAGDPFPAPGDGLVQRAEDAVGGGDDAVLTEHVIQAAALEDAVRTRCDTRDDQAAAVGLKFTGPPAQRLDRHR